MIRRVLAYLVVLVAAASMVDAATTYKLVKLPLTAEDINNKGHVVGEVGDSWCRAALWMRGKIRYLETDSERREVSCSFATAINDHDQIVGYRQVTGALTSNMPLYWADGKFSEPKGGRGGRCGGKAVGINNKGQMVGWVDNGNVENLGSDALFWSSAKATAKSIGWGTSSSAEAINDLGDIVFTIYDRDGGCQLCLVSDGKTTVITDKRVGYRIELNNRRQIVGSFVSEGAESSFIWSKGKLSIVKSPFKDLESIYLLDINNCGQAVGYATDLHGKCQAVLWQNGRVSDLSKLVKNIGQFKLNDPRAINDRGQIVGDGWLLTPIGR